MISKVQYIENPKVINKDKGLYCSELAMSPFNRL